MYVCLNIFWKFGFKKFCSEKLLQLFVAGKMCNTFIYMRVSQHVEK